MLDKRHIDQFVVTAENIADFGVVHNAFSAITHLNYFLLFAPYPSVLQWCVTACRELGSLQWAGRGFGSGLRRSGP